MSKMMTLLISIMLLLVALSGCNPVEEYTLDELDAQINDEYERIQLLIPSEFTEEFLLPNPSDDSFTFVYRINGVLIVDRIVEYNSQPEDEEISISISIRKGFLTNQYNKIIIQRGYEDPDNRTETDILFDEVFLAIHVHIPDTLTSNLTLPEPSYTGVSISYNVDCTDIVRGRMVYSFPLEDTNCNITANVTYQSETRSRQIPVTMASVNHLPRVPEIHINTNGNVPILNDKAYVGATMTVVKNAFLPFPDITNMPLSIRTRGNSTLYMPKQSYKIKFDEKTRLLSNYAEKDWVLLANYTDHTLIRNSLAFAMANRIKMDFVPFYLYVDVYVNGVYQGNYVLTDQIEVSNDRVNIEENVSDIDTGYLFELDHTLDWIGYEASGQNYFLVDGIPFVLKSPNEFDDHYVSGHLDYIQNYMETVYQTLQNQEDYTDLIDEASFIDWFIVNEVFKNVDSGYSSIYFYKDKGGKLKMGPVWDFDLSTGNPGHLQYELRLPEGWYTARQDKNIFFFYLMQYPDFQQHLKERWNELYESAILPVLDDVFETSDSITYSRYQNFELWHIIGINFDWYTAPEIYELKTYDEQVWFLYDYLKTRIEWLNTEINGL